MDRLNYLNFELQVERHETGYRIRVLNSPAGQASAISSLPLSDLEIENFLLRIGRPRQGVRRLESPEMEAIRVFGKQLFEAFFSGEVRDRLRSSLAETRRQGVGLRLQLRLSDVPELSELPWEFLFDPSVQQFPVLSVQTPIVRYLDLPQQIQPLKIDLPLNILTMISCPSDYPLLDVEQEWERLKGSLAELEQRELVKLDRLEAATLSCLQRELRKEEYHIFHFIGHGGFDERSQDGVLVLEDDTGRGRLVSGRYLGTLLHDERSLRLAVLNACEGARTSRSDPFSGAAHSLVQVGIPAVVAMQFEITDKAALTFAYEFYSALSDGYPVDASLAEARKAIFAQSNDVEWGTPVLYLRAPDAHIFEITSEIRPPIPPVPEKPVLPEMVVEPDQITVVPGEYASFVLSLHNSGEVKGEYRLEVDGVPEDWLIGLSEQVEVPPGEVLNIPLKLQPLRSSTTRAGRYPIILQAALNNVPEKAIEIRAMLTVATFQDFSSKLQPKKLIEGEMVDVLINNQGNIHQDFDLACQDSTNRLEFNPGEAQLRLKEGQEGKTTFRVTPQKRPVLGGKRRMPYQVQVSASGNPSQSLQGEVAVQPRIPLWLQLLVGGGLALFALIIVFFVSGIYNRAPEIDQAGIQPESPMAGESVTVYWTVRRATSIDLRPLVFDLDPELGQYTFEGGFEDQLSITFYARNSAGSDQRSIPIPIIVPAAAIETETVFPSPTHTFSQTSTPTPYLESGSTAISSKDGAVLIYIPEGQFWMGSNPEDDPYFHGAEAPMHQVFLDSYWIYLHEVTNLMYKGCVDEQVCPEPQDYESATRSDYFINPTYNDFPVIHIPWRAAADYCSWVGGRLPTEAEWEKASRGTDIRLFAWGNDPPTGDKANYCDKNCPDELYDPDQDDGYSDTAPVGSYPSGASFYGVMDMAGNVGEWTSDWFSTEYYEISPKQNPQGPDTGERRVVRGGSWYSPIDGIRTINRRSEKPELSNDTLGFRCVMDNYNDPLFAQSPTPITESHGGLIAFYSNRTGNNDIYIVNADGTNIRQLTTSPSHDQVPSWSPDGKQIAYQSNEGGDWEIHVINLADGAIQKITSNDCNDYSPVWSPDGNQFVYYSDCDGNREIYTMDIDGTNINQLTHDNSAYNWFPSWSNDGQKITFSSNRSGGKYQVYVMNADGSNKLALAQGCNSSFSPDNELIIFSSYCQDSGDIWLMNNDGTNIRQLTTNEKNRTPSWSPDGEWIVFQIEVSPDNFDIYVMNKNGDNLTPITDGEFFDGAPVWQP